MGREIAGVGRALIWWLAIFSSVLILINGEGLPFLAREGVPHYARSVISEAADIVVQRLGWDKSDGSKISSVDMKDAKLGETVMYEFDIEVGGVILPIILREEITAWRFLEDLGEEEGGGGGGGEDTDRAINIWKPGFVPATLRPFQLAGPVDLLIQDPDKFRLVMPNDVDAKSLKKVLIADGAIVTVEGAREVSLTRPLAFPPPLHDDGGLETTTTAGLASTLLHLASRLRLASRSEGSGAPLISMRIVGPTALVATAAPTESAASESHTEAKAELWNTEQPVGLKVGRLSQDAVELVSRKSEIVSVVDSHVGYSSAGPDQSPPPPPWLWPLASLNASNPDLVALDQALVAILGLTAGFDKQGSVTLLKAKAAVTNFVKIGFQLERPATNESALFHNWPDWAPMPSVERVQFELLARVEDGHRLRAISINQVDPISYPTVSVSWGELTGNQTSSKFSPFLGTVDPMTLDYEWDGDLAL